MRSLLILTTSFACFLGWMVSEQRQSEFERRLGEELQPDQEHAFGAPSRFVSITYLGKYDSLELHEQKQPQGWWRDLARHALGDRIFELQVTPAISHRAFDQLLRCRNLQSLTLGKIPFDDLNPLAGHTSLQQLTISDRSLRDLAPVARLSRLSTLQIDASSIEDLSPLSSLKKLAILRISYAETLSDLTPLAKLESLAELELPNTSVCDLAPIAELTSLTRLAVHRTPVRDLAPLSGLHRLEELHVSGSPFLDEQVESLQQRLPDCNIRRFPSDK